MSVCILTWAESRPLVLGEGIGKTDFNCQILKALSSNLSQKAFLKEVLPVENRLLQEAKFAELLLLETSNAFLEVQKFVQKLIWKTYKKRFLKRFVKLVKTENNEFCSGTAQKLWPILMAFKNH